MSPWLSQERVLLEQSMKQNTSTGVPSPTPASGDGKGEGGGGVPGKGTP